MSACIPIHRTSVDHKISALFKAVIVSCFVFYMPSAYAEVLDKVPYLSFIWGVALASGVACLMATYFRRWLLILAAFPIAWFLSLFLEIHSPDVEPSILFEAGYTYIIQAYLAAFFVVALGVLGWTFNAKKRRVYPVLNRLKKNAHF